MKKTSTPCRMLNESEKYHITDCLQNTVAVNSRIHDTPITMNSLAFMTYLVWNKKKSIRWSLYSTILHVSHNRQLTLLATLGISCVTFGPHLFALASDECHPWPCYNDARSAQTAPHSYRCAVPLAKEKTPVERIVLSRLRKKESVNTNTK